MQGDEHETHETQGAGGSAAEREQRVVVPGYDNSGGAINAARVQASDKPSHAAKWIGGHR